MAGATAGAITIQVDPEGGEDQDGLYRLIGPNGEEGDLTEFGVPAVLDIGNERYMAFVDLDGQADEVLGPPAYLISPVQTTVEEVEFEDDEVAAAAAGEAVETVEETVEQEGDEEEEEEGENGEGDEDDDEGDDLEHVEASSSDYPELL